MIQSEKEIQRRVRTILEKNKTIPLQTLLDQVYDDLRKVACVQKKDVETILKKILRDNEILISPRLFNNEVLENIERKAILACLIQHPRFNLEELSHFLGIPKNKLAWHLTFLQKFQYIRLVSRKRGKIYSPTNKAMGGDPDESA